ncbi:uncharacterized protein LOC122248039 isoform X2 [Penaeus japonicus]|uniref:uncharacterized protein LOC122248039 isoform X2 n=1 Tax=Penaeus japonicus TaxID=27405 RepID=UPI001C70BDB0|nr:uncharacterized protein LOC122248039 isoform X2 [Penaeus japonicus]XP_042863755.1 uncharacterized protein LOC122248039 isoform X2 [Penaeus japonicus]XP_042863756.1 uncharacterized protein LOC122248039 isoform X2 [Penaeus japonicus]XP_042863757.1 uncharacterized protein LOC122248039 isoform X2 [Penaeus japonicus]XP_042863758.1 uncharacterized protein LOC122248039 isoform X2 [Penaeus japonicus]
MDQVENTLVTTSHIAGAMNYPSTTQALFALIVMIIVLLFILVYCCWGTFSCARQDDASTAEDGAVGNQQQGQQGGGQMVIVPFSNMLYVGDPESRRIYQIPLDQDKPPAYTEVFTAGPPPPYCTDTTTTDVSSNTPDAEPETRNLLPDLPPSYEDCLSDPSSEDKSQAAATESTQDQTSNQESNNAQPSTDPSSPQTNSTTVSELQPAAIVSNVPGQTESLVSPNVTQSWRLEGIILRPANLPSLERRGTEAEDNTIPPSQNSAQSS